MTTKELLHFYIKKKFKNSIMITSSFGAESIVILHLCSKIDPNIPILFLNTGKLFTATLTYLKRVQKLLKLTNIKIYEPDEIELARNDPKAAIAKYAVGNKGNDGGEHYKITKSEPKLIFVKPLTRTWKKVLND